MNRPREFSLDRIVKAVALSVLAAISIALLSGPGAGGNGPSRLTLQERRGKQIYLRGTSPSGAEITAVLAEGSSPMPAAALSCVACHGYDGLGRPEGGAIPSDITWDALTKQYGVTHAGGRTHPAYNERSMALAISAGIDPAGNKLSVPMPLYRMSREDMADLVAYLKRVGKDPDPGLADTTITLGTILPSRGPLSGVGESVRAMLEAYIAEINSQGGVYSRRIELRVADCGSTPSETRSALERLVQTDQVFAMLGAFIAGADKEIAGLMDSEEIPLVGPLTLFPQVSFPLNRYVFYLQPGMREQACALVSFAKVKLGFEAPRVAVIYPATEMAQSALDGVDEHCKQVGCGSLTRIKLDRQFEAAAVVAELMRKQIDTVLLLGSAESEMAMVTALTKEAERKRWAPRILIPGPAATKGMLETLAAFDGKAFVSLPTLPSQGALPGIGDYYALAAKYKLRPEHIPSQFSAYSAARVLVEGLKRAGRDLSREKLVSSLEGLYEFETGLMPPVSYGPNRRIGVPGAYVVDLKPEKGKEPSGEWIKLN